MSYKIYKHTTPDGLIYIGRTGMKPEYRWNNGKGYKNHELFFDAIVKHGWNNITHEILEEVETIEEATEKEQHYIRLYQSHVPGKGFNIQSPNPDHKKMRKVFVCEETGEVFENLKQASQAVNVCVSAIS